MASLDEPYLVTSYGITPGSSRPSKNEDERFKLGVTSVIYRETSKAGKAGKQQSRRAIAVNTVQGNGIHLVDLSDQSPLSAFTVSPATVFTCKAISISSEARNDPLNAAAKALVVASGSSAGPSSANKARSRKTFVGLEQDGEYQLCCWTEVEDADGTAVGDTKKVTKTVAHPIIAVSHLEGSILAFDNQGTVLLLDNELNELARHELGLKNDHINRIEPLPYAQLLNSEGLLVSVDNQVILRVPVLCFESPAVAADEQASPKKSKKRRSDAHQIDVQSVSVQSQRASVVYLTIGRRQKKIAEAGRVLLPAEGVVDCIQLQPGKFATLDINGNIKTIQIDRTALVHVKPRDPFTTSSTSLPLLSSNEQILKLKSGILSFRYARLLPASLAQSSSSLSSCLLLAAPRTDRLGTVDISLWDTSLNLALARRELSLPTLLEKEGCESLSILTLPDGLIGLAYTPTSDITGLDTQAQLAKRLTLHAMTCVVPSQMNLASVVGKRASTQQYVDDGKIQAANPLATEGDAQTTEGKLVHNLAEYLTNEKATRDVPAAEKTFQAWLEDSDFSDSKTRTKKKLASLSSKLARPIIELAVPSEASLSVASNIARNILLSRKISDASVEGGLCARLLQHQEWELIHTALQVFDDIPEIALLAILSASISNDRQAPVSLQQMLRLVVKAPSSPSTLRSCLKKQLNVDEVKAILLLMNRWLAVETKQNALDGLVKTDSPGTNYIVPFLQALLDAHLVTVLQSNDLHPLIQSISSHLVEAITFSASLQSLQGPLEVFSKEHEKEKARQLALKKARNKKGRYEVESWNAKKTLQENQLLLGDYAVETFQL